MLNIYPSRDIKSVSELQGQSLCYSLAAGYGYPSVVSSNVVLNGKQNKPESQFKRAGNSSLLAIACQSRRN
jgi:hypothetical protein